MVLYNIIDLGPCSCASEGNSWSTVCWYGREAQHTPGRTIHLPYLSRHQVHRCQLRRACIQNDINMLLTSSWTRLSCTWTGYCCYGDYFNFILEESNCTSMCMCTVLFTNRIVSVSITPSRVQVAIPSKRPGDRLE